MLGPAAGLVHFLASLALAVGLETAAYMVTASIPGAPCAATLLLMPLARLHLLPLARAFRRTAFHGRSRWAGLAWPLLPLVR